MGWGVAGVGGRSFSDNVSTFTFFYDSVIPSLISKSVASGISH